MHETVTNLKALEIWTAQTLCDLGILLSVISFLLHIGRSYFERILARFTLRVAADIWWVVYVVLRDGTLLFATLFGFWHMNLDIMADIKVGLPFVPLGTVALAGALLIKVFRNAEDVNRSLRISTWLVTLGAFLNTFGFVFVMEGPGDEYTVSKSVFWQTVQSWKSDENPQLSTITFYVTFAMLTMMAAFAVAKAVRLFGTTEKEKPEDV